MSPKRAWGEPLKEDQPLFDAPRQAPAPPLEPLVVRGEITIRLTFEADMEVLVRRFKREYLNVDMGSGHQAFERPAVFLHELLTDGCEVIMYEPPGLTDTSTDDLDIEFRWSEADTAELFRRLA